MALMPCRECGKQISDQADVCPNCGIKSLANGAAPNRTSSSEEREKENETILALGNVIVTRTLAKFPSQTFPINGIGSVTLVAPRRAGWIIGATFFGLIGFMILMGSSSGGNDGSGAGVGVFLLVLGGIFFVVAFMKEHGLFIKTASGDARAMEGSPAMLNKVKDAIERAATMRG